MRQTLLAVAGNCYSGGAMKATQGGDGMGTRMHKVTVALALVLLVPLLIATATIGSAHNASYASSVSIDYDQPNFEGRVQSERERCERGRTVSIFKVLDGPDRLIGTDETNDNGFYSVPKAGAQGKFYARVAREVFGGYEHNHVCQGDTSGRIRVGNNN
jgi:hypothetical protein